MPDEMKAGCAHIVIRYEKHTEGGRSWDEWYCERCNIKFIPTTALERARGEAMREVLDELGSLPAIYFGEGSPSIALGNQMFLCAKLRKQFLKEDKHHA